MLVAGIAALATASALAVQADAAISKLVMFIGVLPVYLERVIEGELRADLANAKAPMLPHHTLLAKDKDPSHPEVRLAYNLAHSIAVELSTDVLYGYARGDGYESVRDLVHGYCAHPDVLLSAKPQIAKQRARSCIAGIHEPPGPVHDSMAAGCCRARVRRRVQALAMRRGAACPLPFFRRSCSTRLHERHRSLLL